MVQGEAEKVPTHKPQYLPSNYATLKTFLLFGRVNEEYGSKRLLCDSCFTLVQFGLYTYITLFWPVTLYLLC